MNFRGKTVWLIGASSGIGAALVPAMVKEGAILAISARRDRELSLVAEEASAFGVRPLVKPLDVLRKEEIDRTYSELAAEWGHLDVLFYNAGMWSETGVEAFDVDEALEVIDVIFLGLVKAVGAVVPDMIRRKEGHIIGMASVAGYAGFPCVSSYSSAKSGVNAFLQAIRMELGKHGVQVTTINPGFVKTRLSDGISFRKPILLTTDQSTEAIMSGLARNQREIHFPLRMSVPAKLFTAMPRPFFEALFVRLPLQRPRRQPIDGQGGAISGEHLPAPAGNEDNAATVEGRAVAPPSAGFGQMWRKEFSLTIQGDVSATAVMEYWKAHLHELWPSGSELYRSNGRIEEGDLLGLDMGVGPVKLASGVVVLESDETSFTLLSPEGHLFAGWNHFATRDTPAGTEASISMAIRASDPLFEAGLYLGGHLIEERFWSQMLRNLAQAFGQDPPVRKSRRLLDGKRQWSHAGNIRKNSLILTVTRRAGRMIGVGGH